jgi:hypothetical protein
MLGRHMSSGRYSECVKVAGFPRGILGFDPRSGHVEFGVNKMALLKVFSVYFGSPCQFSPTGMVQ